MFQKAVPMQNVTNPFSLLSLYPPIPQSPLRQVHSLYQSQFSTQSDLVLPLPVFSTPSFP